MLERLPIKTMAVSLDAANAKSFDALRVRGKNAHWSQVMLNLDKLSDLKRRKNFAFTISMTLNSVNALEIEDFVDLALQKGAEPLIMLVANPYETSDFQRKFLLFTPPQFDQMENQINHSLAKIKGKGLSDAEIYLEQLRVRLRKHRATDNDLIRYRTKRAAQKVFRRLPEHIQDPLKRVVQKHRRDTAEKDQN